MKLREKIVMTALDLFGDQGYDKTTIAQICRAAGTSKGGFYHHFESKEQVLATITDLYFTELKERYAAMLGNTSASTLTLLSQVFATVNTYKEQQFAKWESLTKLYGHRDSHAIIMKLALSFEEVTAEIYEELLMRGVEEGLFRIPNPKALGRLWSHEMVVLYGMINRIFADPGNAALQDEYRAQAEFLETVINQALGFAEPQVPIAAPALAYLELVLGKMAEMGYGGR